MALRCSELFGHDFEACQVDAAAGADVALPSVDQSLYILPLGVEELIVQGAAGRPSFIVEQAFSEASVDFESVRLLVPYIVRIQLIGVALLKEGVSHSE